MEMEDVLASSERVAELGVHANGRHVDDLRADHARHARVALCEGGAQRTTHTLAVYIRRDRDEIDRRSAMRDESSQKACWFAFEMRDE